MPLDALTLAKLTGEEAFVEGGRIADDAPVGHSMTVLDFWRWSASDLLSNTMRGIVAEYIVAKALGLTDQPREEWRAYDLERRSKLQNLSALSSRLDDVPIARLY